MVRNLAFVSRKDEDSNEKDEEQSWVEVEKGNGVEIKKRDMHLKKKERETRLLWLLIKEMGFTTRITLYS